ncbi:filaggrin-2-like [Lytechinus variegatus]|uniref:filaggrin-2-like n=1 Tax=Lytechinus variegatus TaxID=7654 RepID=UPI001BB19661|nr:filaggrin-2-like [Lytechinus variegatus]
MVLSEQNFILFEKVERVLDWKVAGTDRGEGWLTDSTRSPWRPSGNRRGCQAGGLAEEGSTLPVGLPGALYLDCVDVQAGQLPEVATRMPGMPSQDGLGSLAGGQPPPRPTGQGRSRPGCRTCPPRTAGAVERDTAQPSISRPGTQTSRQGSRSSTQRRAGAFERQPAQPSVGQGPAPPDQAAARQLRRWQGLWSDRQPTSSRPGTRTSRPGTRSSTQRRAGAFERDTAHLQSARHPLLEARHPLVNPETGWGPLSDRQPTSSRPGPRSSRRQDVHAKPTLPSKAGTRTSHPTSVGAVKRDTAHKEADRPPQVDARHPLVNSEWARVPYLQTRHSLFNSEVGRGFGATDSPPPDGQGPVHRGKAAALPLRGRQGLWSERQPTSSPTASRRSRAGIRSSTPKSAGAFERQPANLQSPRAPWVEARHPLVNSEVGSGFSAGHSPTAVGQGAVPRGQASALHFRRRQGLLSETQPNSSGPGSRTFRPGTRSSTPTFSGDFERQPAQQQWARVPYLQTRHPLVNSDLFRGFGVSASPRPDDQGPVGRSRALVKPLLDRRGLPSDSQPTSSPAAPRRRQDVHAKPTLPLNPPWSLQAIPTGGSRRSGPTAPRLPSPVSRPPSLEFAGDSDRRISTQRADSAPPAEPGLPPAHPGVCRRI